MHAGEVHFDGKGYFGEALDVAFRLLEARRLKESLSRGPGPLVLVVSDVICWSIVSQDYEGIPRESYQPVLRVMVAGRRRTGWLHVPGPRAVERAQAEAVPARPARAARHEIRVIKRRVRLHQAMQQSNLTGAPRTRVMEASTTPHRPCSKGHFSH